MSGVASHPHCPACKAHGLDPMPLGGRTTYRYEHADGCRIAEVIAGAAAPRTEYDYLGGIPQIFEPAEQAERGHVR
jgi:hypothetical protein